MCFWLGDLNYRMDETYDVITAHIVRGTWAVLLESDQVDWRCGVCVCVRVYVCVCVELMVFSPGCCSLNTKMG